MPKLQAKNFSNLKILNFYIRSKLYNMILYMIFISVWLRTGSNPANINWFQRKGFIKLDKIKQSNYFINYHHYLKLKAKINWILKPVSKRKLQRKTKSRIPVKVLNATNNKTYNSKRIW